MNRAQARRAGALPWIAAALAAAGCGAGDDPSPAGGCRIEGRSYEISAGEIDHACGHLADGPFGDLAAGDALTNLHMLYTVALEDRGDGSFGAEIGFTALEATTHVFYHLADAPAAYRDEGGEDLCVAATVVPSGCDGIRRVDLIDLDDRQSIRIALGPSPETAVRLVAERK